jgi:hypothetical protein
MCAMIVVLVHYGQHFPEHIHDCIKQLKKYSPTTEVHILLEKTHDVKDAKVVSIDKIPKSLNHEKFNQVSKLDRDYRGGFWHAAAERFMAISDYMEHTGFTDIIHIEYDNLVYMNISHLLPVLQKHYKHIAVPTDSPGRVIPSFVYFRDVESIHHMTNFMVDNVPKFTNEMQLLKAYMNVFPERMKALPIARPPFAPDEYTNHLDEFKCIFDAAALGQYVGGIDPRNTPGNTEGFINETCIFPADRAGLEWRDGRPWAFGLPVVNLHIHCKNLKKWSMNSK